MLGDRAKESGSLMTYSAPTITDHGSLLALTGESKVPNDGNDPCRFQNPRGWKQTGLADYIQGNANLTTCVPTTGGSI
jgi:hypothetical protein